MQLLMLHLGPLIRSERVGKDSWHREFLLGHGGHRDHACCVFGLTTASFLQLLSWIAYYAAFCSWYGCLADGTGASALLRAFGSQSWDILGRVREEPLTLRRELARSNSRSST
jgi:hypothetical protein